MKLSLILYASVRENMNKTIGTYKTRVFKTFQAFATDAVEEERGKGEKCSSNLPANCVECHYLNNSGDLMQKSQALNHCRNMGWNKNMSVSELLGLSFFMLKILVLILCSTTLVQYVRNKP